MPKINIVANINNNGEDNSIKTVGILQEGLLKYKEKDKTLVIYNYKKNTLIRENNELRMNYLFEERKETIGKIFIKELNKELELIIKTKQLKQKENNVKIEFEIENNKFVYQLEEIK